MSTDTLSSTDVSILEALDFPILCKIRLGSAIVVAGVRIGAPSIEATCEQPAVSHVRSRGCSRGTVVCVGHRDILLGLPAIICAHCNASGPALVVYEFTPLAGA